MTLALAAEQLDIADHFDASSLRGNDSPVRLGMRQRHARRQHQRREILPRHGPQVRRDKTFLRGFRQFRRRIIAGDHLRAACLQGAAARKPRPAEAEDRNSLTCERRDWCHYRNFSVERPMSASITETIQNRITICGSVQPFCS